MWTPIRLKVEGFRGFRSAQEFIFDHPATQLFGENHSCKSSTLNAIEWALFGGDCCGKQTGMRERIGWIIPNQHLPAPSVSVELEMQSTEGTNVILRSLRQVSKKTTPDESLELTLANGSTLAGAEAEERLAALLKSSFRDFLTTVYQHQEAIRATLTQEPKDRNDAIDRLLGLSDRRNLHGALDAANLGNRQKELSRRFAEFEQQIQVTLAARDNDLADLLRAALEEGMARSQLTAKAALNGAASVAVLLKQFADEAKLEAPELQVPGDARRLFEFDKAVMKAISRLRGQVPGIAEQKELLGRQKQWLTLHAAHEHLRRRLADASTQSQALDMEHGSRKAVDTKVADATVKLEAERERLRQTSGKAAVINEAIQFLEKAEDESSTCPICGTEVPDLLDQVRRLWADKLSILVEHIKAQIEELNTDIKEQRAVVGLYQNLGNKSEQLGKEQAQLREQTARLLQRELDEDDDALALVTGELKSLESRLDQLEKAIQERQERLDAIEQDLAKVRLVREYLQVEAKKQVLESIQKSESFRQLESLRDQISELVEDAEAIKNAVAALSREDAESKLATAEKTIDQYFCQLSRNPAVLHLKLAITSDKRSHQNAYNITDQDGKDLTPILSQGDLNALALAIFLGLAASAKESSFGFLMLDDPSQSLGSEHKKQLAAVLDKVAQHKKLIVATMDAEFHQYLRESLTKAKKEYHFGKWTPNTGPSISESPDSNGRAAAAGVRKVSSARDRR